MTVKLTQSGKEMLEEEFSKLQETTCTECGRTVYKTKDEDEIMCDDHPTSRAI